MNKKDRFNLAYVILITVLLIFSAFCLSAYHSEKQPSEIMPTMQPNKTDNYSSNVGYIEYSVSGNATGVGQFGEAYPMPEKTRLTYDFYTEGRYFVSIEWKGTLLKFPNFSFEIDSKTMAPTGSSNCGKEMIESVRGDVICDAYQCTVANSQFIFYIDPESKLILQISGDIVSAIVDTDKNPTLAKIDVILKYKSHSLEKLNISQGPTGGVKSIPISGEENITVLNDGVSESKKYPITGKAEISTVSSIKNHNGDYENVINISMTFNYEKIINQYFNLEDLLNDGGNRIGIAHTETLQDLTVVVPEYSISYDGENAITASGTITSYEYDENGILLKETINEFCCEGKL
ncbi:hypothetical protein [Candidatus Methanomassiliicoccus intestinalis]|uniref:hypothetical protein n=1 Tax=Candidatus Methanomassiliicoccus intestinalis TaxID=1406512 RepID=UPI0037DDA5A1